MSYKDYYPSRYLKVDDLKGRKLALTIDRFVAEEVGQGLDKKEKPVIYFRETTKGLVLNRINGDTVAEIVGTDDEQSWTGHRILLVPSRTEYQGKRVGCVRIEAPGDTAALAAPADIFDNEFGDDAEVQR